MIRKLILTGLVFACGVHVYAGEPKPTSQRRDDFLKWKFGMTDSRDYGGLLY
jgi:hypothetical protein